MFFDSEHKLESRRETIIRPYRRYFGDRIPDGKQYWTLCAECARDGKLLPESEFAQVLEEGLITKDQFYGVDLDSKAIEENKKLGYGNFIEGNFLGVIGAYKNFNPAVVNLDLLSSYKRNKYLIRTLFRTLSEHNGLIYNINVFTQNFRSKGQTSNEIIDDICEDEGWLWFFKLYNWETAFQTHVYKGKGNDTVMTSLTFFKK